MGKLIIRWEGTGGRYGQEKREMPDYLACPIFLAITQLMELLIKIGKEERDENCVGYRP